MSRRRLGERIAAALLVALVVLGAFAEAVEAAEKPGHAPRRRRKVVSRIQPDCGRFLQSFPEALRSTLRGSAAIDCECGQGGAENPPLPAPQTANLGAVAGRLIGSGFAPDTDEARQLRGCVVASLGRGAFNGSSYRWCDSDRQPRGGRDARPVCQSSAGDRERYAELMAGSLLYVSRCMGVDWRNYYPLLNQESGFRHNVMSYTGAGGLGQFTKFGVEGVNQARARANAPFRWPTKPGCELIGQDPGIVSKFRCSRIAGPGNPVRGLAYTIALAQINAESSPPAVRDRPRSKPNQIRAALAAAWARRPERQGKTPDPAELDFYVGQILMVFSQQAHNAGAGGAWAVMRELMDRASAGGSVRMPASREELRAFFRHYQQGCEAGLRTGLWGRSQAGEHAKYSTHVQASLPRGTDACLPPFMRSPR